MLVGVGAAWVGTVRLPRRGKLIILRGARLEITHHWMGEEMGGGGGGSIGKSFLSKDVKKGWAHDAVGW